MNYILNIMMKNGKTSFDDKILFEYLMLDIMQAGLNWFMILRKRDNFRKAFDNFDVVKVSQYDEKKVIELLNNPGIIRNRKKIEAVINNAKCFIKVQKEWGSFSNYLWSFVNHQPIINHYDSIKEIPAKTELSDIITKDLKKWGFKFLGSTIVYAYLQSIGIVDDHIDSCIFKTKEAII